MKKKSRKLSKSLLAAIITAAVAAVLIAALLILNVFIPVKYFSAYVVKKYPNERGVMRVSFIDQEMGDSILIELPDGKNMLIDGGDGAYPHVLSLLGFLNGRGVESIDYLVCTSVKSEHCGGLAEILKYKKVGRAYIPYCKNQRITEEYNRFVSAIKKKGVEYAYGCAGAGAYGEDYFFSFLSPADYNNPLSEYTAMNKSPNSGEIENASCVIWLEYADTAFAFTSDVRPAALKRIIEEYDACLKLGLPFGRIDGCTEERFTVNLENCDVVTAPAHGARLNTYAPWYDTLKPTDAVISVGNNYSGCPSVQALSDVCAYCEPYLTAEKGNITITVNDKGYKISEGTK